VDLPIAMLLLPTALFVTAITSATFQSIYAAFCDAAHAPSFAKPIPAELVIPWMGNGWAGTNIRLPPVPPTFGLRIYE